MRNVSVSRNESRHQRTEWTAGWDGKGEVAFPPEPPTTLHVRAIKQMQIAKVAGKNAHLSQPPKKANTESADASSGTEPTRSGRNGVSVGIQSRRTGTDHPSLKMFIAPQPLDAWIVTSVDRSI
jgi:hypothetical protein